MYRLKNYYENEDVEIEIKDLNVSDHIDEIRVIINMYRLTKRYPGQMILSAV